jgi:hypothetical protein
MRLYEHNQPASVVNLTELCRLIYASTRAGVSVSEELEPRHRRKNIGALAVRGQRLVRGVTGR